MKICPTNAQLFKYKSINHPNFKSSTCFVPLRSLCFLSYSCAVDCRHNCARFCVISRSQNMLLTEAFPRNPLHTRGCGGDPCYQVHTVSGQPLISAAYKRRVRCGQPEGGLKARHSLLSGARALDSCRSPCGSALTACDKARCVTSGHGAKTRG